MATCIVRVLFLGLLIVLSSCTTITTSDSVRSKLERTYEKPYSEVYSQSVSTLMALKWQLVSSDKDEGLIQAKTPTTIWTFGDLVTVHVVPEMGKTRVDITSASAQQIDWGKNKRNIEEFYKELDKSLQ